MLLISLRIPPRQNRSRRRHFCLSLCGNYGKPFQWFVKNMESRVWLSTRCRKSTTSNKVGFTNSGFLSSTICSNWLYIYIFIYIVVMNKYSYFYRLWQSYKEANLFPLWHYYVPTLLQIRWQDIQCKLSIAVQCLRHINTVWAVELIRFLIILFCAGCMQ